jgi:hypothetical protein
MTVQTLAAEIGIDPGDIDVVARWLTADEALDDAALELELRAVLDPAGQRTATRRSGSAARGLPPARRAARE